MTERLNQCLKKQKHKILGQNFFIRWFTEFFFQIRMGGGGWGGGGKKEYKKPSENDQLTGHFQNFFFIFFFHFQSFFFNISRKNSKTSEVNQQSVLNLYIFHHFPKNLDRTITFYSVTLKNTNRTSNIYIIFFN